MPVTARLSHTLHRTLGDDAASDLVEWMQLVDHNRLELRELNELNFARLDTRMDRHEQVMEARFTEAREATRAQVKKVIWEWVGYPSAP